MNPLSLLSGAAPAASASAPPPVASNGGALLAMLQGSGIGGMPNSKTEAAPAPAAPAAAEPARTAPQKKNGITLSRGSAVHEVGNSEASSSRKQTQVTHIAAYKFQPGKFPAARLLLACALLTLRRFHFASCSLSTCSCTCSQRRSDVPGRTRTCRLPAWQARGCQPEVHLLWCAWRVDPRATP
eukprot:578605-Rhodomonas_salina.1